MSDEIEKAGGTPEIVPSVEGSEGGAANAASGSAGTMSAPVAGPLSPEDLARVADIARQIDVNSAQAVLSYGIPAQERLARFADDLLGDVRNKDAGAGGEALNDLLRKVREIDVDALGDGSGKGRIPIFGRFASSFDRFATRYQKVATSIDRIILALERSKSDLLRDMTNLDKLYQHNLDYIKQLDVYVAAGEQVLDELLRVRIPAMEVEVAASGDLMAAQRLTDLQQSATRFERRLHDLKLTRMIAIQTAPQIRLIQSNDQGLVERIQASLLTTIPLWKNQIVIAITLYRQQKAVELQREVTDTTNELLAKNAELLKTGSAKVAREVERGVVDIETLQKVNADLIATLEETIQIQAEGRVRRAAAEGELTQMQRDLKQKLLELRGTAPQIVGAGDPPRMLP